VQRPDRSGRPGSLELSLGIHFLKKGFAAPAETVSSGREDSLLLTTDGHWSEEAGDHADFLLCQSGKEELWKAGASCQFLCVVDCATQESDREATAVLIGKLPAHGAFEAADQFVE